MIVDDHKLVRNSVARLVRSWGHEVALANDGPAALLLADEFKPDFAIVDFSLPGMNGSELARRLRQRFPPAQLYLIAFTGYADADIRDACLDAGFDVHLVKPADINLLEKLLGSDRAGA
jgi:CheY-like chemotaxis protein